MAITYHIKSINANEDISNFEWAQRTDLAEYVMCNAIGY